MVLLLSPEMYRSVEKMFGAKQAQECAIPLDASANAADKVEKALAKMEEVLVNVRDKAGFLISPKKFEVKNEPTKALFTKVDIAELEAESARIEFKLERKFTLMVVLLFFALHCLHPNAGVFSAKPLRLKQPSGIIPPTRFGRVSVGV